jgi:hypothetical protein
MRTTVLTLSLTMALCSGQVTLRAQDESSEVEQADYTTEWQSSEDDNGSFGFADEPVSGTAYISPRYWFTTPAYGTYIQADALWLARFHGPANQPIAVALPPGSIPNLHTNDVSLSDRFEPGAIFTVGFNIDQVSSLEATYFGLNEWKSNAQVSDPAGQLGLAGSLQNSTVDYIFSDRITEVYKSQINNAEANYKQTIEGLTLLAGFRYFRLSETFDINSHSAMFNESSDYKINTVNQLLGAQFGMGYTWQWGAWNANLIGKIGPYANLAHQNTLLQDVGNTFVLRRYRAETTPVSTLAEVGLNGAYQVNNWFSLHAGYRFIWIQNVAFAPDQLDLTNSPPGTHVMNAHNHLFLHGVNVGAEIRW